MSIALTGFLTGFAKGAKERIEKEREENEALIESRLKMAATNRLKREKERDAQKTLLNQRYDLVSGYLPPDATEEQKLALISNETIAKEFAAMRTKGEAVDLNKFLVVNKDKIPQGFTSVRQYIDTLSAAPTALSQEQMQQAFGETKGFLGARTGVSAGRAEKIAKQFGAPAAELLAYEQPQELPQMPEVARMNVEMLKEEKEKRIKSPTERLQERLSLALGYAEAYGKDSPEAIAAQQLYAEEKERQETLNPSQLKFADIVNEAQLARVEALRKFGINSPQYKSAEKQLKDIQGKEAETGGALTHEQARKIIVNGGANAVALEYGRNPNVAISTDQFGVKSIDYIGDPKSAASKKIRATQLEAIARAVRPYLDSSGRPLYPSIRDTLMEAQVPFDSNGRPIFNVTLPPDTDTTPGASPVGASRVTPSAAVPTTRPAAPTVAPAAGAAQPAPVTPQPTARPRVDIAAERKAANDAIAKGADKAAVEERFKERTGQNL